MSSLTHLYRLKLDENGQVGVVTALEGQNATVDLNHQVWTHFTVCHEASEHISQLAGQTVNFGITLVDSSRDVAGQAV